jgi:hypothetical protein
MALKHRAYTRPSPAQEARPRGASHEVVTSRRVATVCAEVSVVRLHGAAVGADLGGSSKYTSEALVD